MNRDELSENGAYLGKINDEAACFTCGENECVFTWEEFYKVRKQELSEGKMNCPRASYMAYELLKPMLMKKFGKNQGPTNESYEDFLQEAWIIIAEHIAEYDEEISKFSTFLDKWFKGLAREMYNDGVSGYQKKVKSIRVYSTDAIVSRSNEEGGNQVSELEIEDEGQDIESIMERRDKAHIDELIHLVIEATISDFGEDIEHIISENDSKKMREIYANVACAKLFLGGIGAMSDDKRDLLKKMLVDKINKKSS